MLSHKNVKLFVGKQDKRYNLKVYSFLCKHAYFLFCRCNDILHVVVIDDNMFYRSMRYEYYQLARKS
jgi:tRNA uridine 5-carbamoylmethylation protein Kti12